MFANLTRSNRGPGRAYLNSVKEAHRTRLALLAEAAAESKPSDSLAAIGRSSGMGKSTTDKLWRQIRRELGDQAK